MFKHPLSKLQCALLTLLIVLPPELLVIKFAAFRGSYGTLLFLGVSFSLGFVSVLIYDKFSVGDTLGGVWVGVLSTLFAGFSLFALGWEGVICLAIAFLIAMPFTLLGVALAFLILKLRRDATVATCVVLLLPALAPFEHHWHNPQQFVVHTSIEIAAPPEKVWPLVVSFPAIVAPPGATLAHAGVAYPLETTITGAGLGVTRRCVFTTGTAEETVDTWDPPYRLHFTVLTQPPLMSETSWVPDLQTEHLKAHYVRSQAGQFDLRALPNGHTLVTGSSWYGLEYWPSSYWHLWTDALVHHIHMRVLEHIKAEVERG